MFSDMHLLFQVIRFWAQIGEFLENNQNMLMFLKQATLAPNGQVQYKPV